MFAPAPRPAEVSPDAILIERSRQGSMPSYAELWRRHNAAAVAVARVFSSSIDPEDLVSEAYTQILAALQRGKGPDGGAFRPYLYAVIRNLARRWGSAKREVTVQEFPEVVDESDSLSIQVDSLEQGMMREAFVGLPRRWQEVLWYTEVERMGPAQVGLLLGMRENSVSALAYRAREGLRQQWLQAHVTSFEGSGECMWALGRMGEQSRGRLTSRNRARMDRHLADCASCADVASEVDLVGHQLAGMLASIVLGGGAATTWLASIGQAGGTAAVAAASASVAGGIAAGAAIGAGATGVITALGLAGTLIFAPGDVGVSSETNSQSQSETYQSTASAGGSDGGDGAERSPATRPGEGAEDLPTPDALPAALGADTQRGLGTVTNGVGGLVNGTTDTLGNLVGTITGGLLTSKVTAGLDLNAPSVSAELGIAGLEVGTDIRLGGESSGVVIDVGDILTVDLGLGGTGGLLGVSLFGSP